VQRIRHAQRIRKSQGFGKRKGFRDSRLESNKEEKKKISGEEGRRTCAALSCARFFESVSIAWCGGWG